MGAPTDVGRTDGKQDRAGGAIGVEAGNEGLGEAGRAGFRCALDLTWELSYLNGGGGRGLTSKEARGGGRRRGLFAGGGFLPAEPNRDVEEVIVIEDGFSRTGRGQGLRTLP